MSSQVHAQPTGLIGVGYQGHDIATFVDELAKAQVSRLVDVRLTPISRKPGFSKAALARALAVVGITYEHRPELGNPKSNRAGFAGSPAELAEARNVFATLLYRPEAANAIDVLAAAGAAERVAVLCFEADQHRCHRDVVLAEAGRWSVSAPGSRRRAR
ncbi:DUF488 domain-containing protein [Micromonospora echinaurantiaca]|uniref:DUF488 domain-containing protein n=1 Tax=Micromonospora echinaurantiaca TaxID=47857 RepID=UPI00341FC1D8